jgi:hypothetical protein
VLEAFGLDGGAVNSEQASQLTRVRCRQYAGVVAGILERPQTVRIEDDRLLGVEQIADPAEVEFVAQTGAHGPRLHVSLAGNDLRVSRADCGRHRVRTDVPDHA